MSIATPHLGDLADLAEYNMFEPPEIDQSKPPEIQCLCPFCGSFNNGVGKPCAHCALEDTVTTRAATAQRQGPWFVLQTRDPSAPGITFETLQSLIRRHVVTSRSVVRGPTTGQLWRLASKVRGLSREFGQCHDCGEDIERDDSVCPHCDRLQTLPDRHEAQADATEAKPAATVETQPAVNDHVEFITQPEAVRVEDPVANIPDPEPITVMSSGSADEAPAKGVVDRAFDRHIPKDDLLTARDVAKAFLLEFGPTAVIPARTARHPRWDYLKFKTGLSLVAVLVLAALIWPVGHVIAGWFQSTPTTLAISPPSPSVPTDTVVPDARVAALADARLADETVIPTPQPAPLTVVATAATPVPSQPIVQPVVFKMNPRAVRTAPAAEPTPAPSVSDDPRTLWNIGIDAESRRQFAVAVQAYERLESLPSASWPAHLAVRLALARRELNGDYR